MVYENEVEDDADFVGKQQQQQQCHDVQMKVCSPPLPVKHHIPGQYWN